MCRANTLSPSSTTSRLILCVFFTGSVRYTLRKSTASNARCKTQTPCKQRHYQKMTERSNPWPTITFLARTHTPTLAQTTDKYCNPDPKNHATPCRRNSKLPALPKRHQASSFILRKHEEKFASKTSAHEEKNGQ